MSDLDRAARHAIDGATVADLTRELAACERAGRRHRAWALLGISPAAAIPLFAAAAEWGFWAFIAGMLAVATREALKAVEAHRRASTLRSQLHDLTKEWSSSSLE